MPVLDVNQNNESPDSLAALAWLAAVGFGNDGIDVHSVSDMTGFTVDEILSACKPSPFCTVSHACLTSNPVLSESVQSQVLENWVEFLMKQARFSPALKIANLLSLIHMEKGDSRAEAHDFGNMGAIYLRTRNLEAATHCFQRASTLHLEGQDRLGHARDQANLGIVSAEMHDTPKALRYLEAALQIFVEEDQQDEADKTLLNIRILRNQTP